MKLNEQIDRVCEHLLPNGKRKGRVWEVGSPNGEAGHSMVVHLDGDRRGGWKDFAGSDDDKGDLFTLWQRTRSVDFKTAVKEAKEFLGLEDTRAESYHRIVRHAKTFVRPTLDQIEPLLSGGLVYDYLTKTRQLDPAVLRAYDVRQVQKTYGWAMVFPAYEPSGKHIDLLKFLAVDREPDGKKNSWSSADSKDHLIGWQTVKPDDREITITEGEIDAYTVAGWGLRALSIPRGVAAMEWIEHDYEALERFDRINLCLDMDAAGHKAAQEIAQRLGRERCFRVILPDFKDANEALCSGRFLGPDFEDCVARARTLDPVELRNLGDMGDEIWESVFPSDQRSGGTESPFSIDWRCRHGELTIWSGYSGHGKSHLLNQFLLHDAHQGERVCVASFEMPAGDTGARLIQMALGAFPDATQRAALKPGLNFLSDRFWVVNVVGVMHWSKLIPLLEYAGRRYGCTRFAVDSLLRLGVDEDDINAQKECVEAFVNFAARYGHVHLVCHSRKHNDESKPPGKLDVRGAAAITDLCHNGFTVWRDKSKEQKLEEARNTTMSMGEVQKYYAMPDAQISMWKNRKKGTEPFRKLWLHQKSGQFMESRDRTPFRYINQQPK